MKQTFLLLILLLCLPLGAQQTYRARVVDAETGEALPYVSIYVAAGRGTITNSNGYFVIEAEPTVQLSFRYVGYETKQVAADALPDIVKMKPYTRELGEVVVKPIPTRDILRQVIKRLDAEYKKHKKVQQVYFFRSVLENQTGAYMMEAFLRARDAVNARDEILLSGIKGKEQRGSGFFPDLNITNIQRHIEIGPKTYGSVFWEKAIKPLDSFSKAKRVYAFDSSILRGEDGKEIYCIDCAWTHEMTHALRNTRYITGRLYVEADTYRMLRFDGKVNNAYQWVDFDRLPSDIRFHITYDHSQGYTSVTNLAVKGGNEQMRYHSIAFVVEGYDNVRKGQKQGSSNLVMAIKETACDSTLWTEEIVRRTEVEERIFRNGMESISTP